MAIVGPLSFLRGNQPCIIARLKNRFSDFSRVITELAFLLSIPLHEVMSKKLLAGNCKGGHFDFFVKKRENIKRFQPKLKS